MLANQKKLSKYKKENNLVDTGSVKKLKINGNKGYIYKVSKLKYDLYNVQEDLNMHYLSSTYENHEERNDHNKIYLFKDILTILIPEEQI